MNPEIVRQRMVQRQVRTWDVFDEDVLRILGSVARESFVPAGYEEVACADTEIPLGYGQVMLRPVIEGRLLQALALGTADRVLEIGTGSGYLAACIAGLSATVTSIDIHDDFITTAGKKLEAAGISNVNLQCMDAIQQLPEGKFDAIAVTGSVPKIDKRFVDSLKPGGRLFLVVGEPPVMSALLIVRTGNDSRITSVFETNIPPLENIPRDNSFSF